jgi:mono/diheme cytochrome c family protein
MRTFAPCTVLAATVALMAMNGCSSAKPSESMVAAPAESAAATSPAPQVTQPEPAAGQAIYDSNCARCHRLGTYDPRGRAPDLSGRQGHITADFVQAHRKLVLNEAQVKELRAFLAAH